MRERERGGKEAKLVFAVTKTRREPISHENLSASVVLLNLLCSYFVDESDFTMYKLPDVYLHVHCSARDAKK